VTYPAGPPSYPPPQQWGGGHDWTPPPPPQPPVKPQSIKVAVAAMWTGAVLSVIGGLSAFLFQDDLREEAEKQLANQGDTGIDADTLVTIALVAAGVGAVIGTILWIVHAINVGKGRNWARIVGTVLYAIALFSFLIGLAQPSPALSRAMGVLNQIVALVALVAMWLPDSNRFVRETDRVRRGY
jgi:hypothetical protein